MIAKAKITNRLTGEVIYSVESRPKFGKPLVSTLRHDTFLKGATLYDRMSMPDPLQQQKVIYCSLCPNKVERLEISKDDAIDPEKADTICQQCHEKQQAQFAQQAQK